MPLRNRVTPLGHLIADPARGLVYGNRGCLHDEEGTIRRHHAGRRWIACRLRFRGWHRHPLLQPGRFTELFFLDDATAMAAGHRACALCRRGDYAMLTSVWASLHPDDRGADAIDARLHEERWDAAARTRRLHDLPIASLPDGAFVLADDRPWLVRGRELVAWTPGGYGDRVRRPTRGPARVITPPSLVDVLRHGWDPLVPFVHPSADR